MKRNLKKIISLVIALTITIAILAGCGAEAKTELAATNEQAGEPAGTILLSVNPEILVEYDNNGKVLELKAKNEDGKKVIEAMADYKGQATELVMERLVEVIYELGYLTKTIAGNERNIIIKLEKGSSYPNEAFLNNIADRVKNTVNLLGSNSATMPIKESDIGQNGYIGLEKAKEIVLTQLGMKEADFAKKDYDLDDGFYEMEFKKDGVEYEYKVNALTGKVSAVKVDVDDDYMVKNTGNKSGYIGFEKAKEIVFNRLGIKESDVRDRDYDLDDGFYEIDFEKDGIEYEYKVNAYTGEIAKEKIDKDDDWDDDDMKTIKPSAPASKPVKKDPVKTSYDDDDWDDDWDDDDDDWDDDDDDDDWDDDD